ncbi:hypothetical protein, partial [Acidocella sp.]|uniref:hypothetical protein n=1 Tax=Acidocella sp. TaxID=50710 RepID=UPI002610B410
GKNPMPEMPRSRIRDAMRLAQLHCSNTLRRRQDQVDGMRPSQQRPTRLLKSSPRCILIREHLIKSTKSHMRGLF